MTWNIGSEQILLYIYAGSMIVKYGTLNEGGNHRRVYESLIIFHNDGGKALYMGLMS